MISNIFEKLKNNYDLAQWLKVLIGSSDLARKVLTPNFDYCSEEQNLGELS